MKWIKSRKKFFILEEAKIRDVILPRQAQAVKSNWGEKFLDLEEIEPTTKIIQGKWKLSQEDKLKVFSAFFGTDMTIVYDILGKLSEKFNSILSESIDVKLFSSDVSEKYTKILEGFDIRTATVDQMILLYQPIFRKISVSETTASEIIVRGEDGRPVMGEDNRPLKRKREEGEVLFSSNLVNINTFLTDYNRCRIEPTDIDGTVFTSRIYNVCNIAADIADSSYRCDYDLFSKDMYISIKHNAKDILNMSISRYYTSCQQLYSGGYRAQLIGNVFDPNSVPAFFIFDTPIYWEEQKISDQLPLCRMMLRSIEKFDSDGDTKIYFDRAYPDRMRSIMSELIPTYSGNEFTATSGRERYLYTPDIPDDYSVRTPYMDHLETTEGKYIGANTTSLCITGTYNWTKTLISPKAKIKELTIETTNIPINLLSLSLNLDWVKFKFLKIKNLNNFDKIKSDAIGFDRCSLSIKTLEDVKKNNPNIKKLQIISCEVNNLNLSMFESLDELQLLFTIDSDELDSVLSGVDVKKLILSGDLVSTKEGKELINSLKKKGIKIEIIGPVI